MESSLTLGMEVHGFGHILPSEIYQLGALRGDKDATSRNSHQGLCPLQSGGWQKDSQWPLGAVQCEQRPFLPTFTRWGLLRTLEGVEVTTVTGRSGGC